jgi:hypothetical protein
MDRDYLSNLYYFMQVLQTHNMALGHNQTIPAERPPLVGEVSDNFCG